MAAEHWKICPSEIHGFGVFSTKTLFPGDQIGEVQCVGFAAAKVRTIPLTCIKTSSGQMLAAVSGFPLWYLNTANDPNVYLALEGTEKKPRARVIAATTIRSGQELTTGWRVPWKT